MQHRDIRVADAIKEAVARIVVNELSDPRIGFVTVTRCSVTRDLKQATVYFSIMGKEEARAESFKHLEHAIPYVRHRLAQEVKLRFLPVLRFKLDEVLAQEMRISEIISEMHRGEPAPEPPATGDTEPGEPD